MTREEAKKLYSQAFQCAIEKEWSASGMGLNQSTVNRLVVGEWSSKSFQLEPRPVSLKPEDARKKAFARKKLTDCQLTKYLVVHFLSEEYNLPEITQNEKINIEFIAKQDLRSMRERIDQEIIDAIDAGLKKTDQADTKGKVISSKGKDLTIAKILEASEYLSDSDYPEDGRHLLMDTNACHNFIMNKEIYGKYPETIRALANGEETNFHGFKLHVVGKLPTGGLPMTKGRADVLIWHEDAVGSASSDISTDIYEYNGWWFSESTIKCGAVTSNGRGTVRIQVANK